MPWFRTAVARWTLSNLALLALPLAPTLHLGHATAEPTVGTASTTIGQQYGGFSPDGNFLWLSDADLAHHMDLMKASGARWVRLGVVWSVIEQKRGVYDWSTTDRVIAAARARGLDVLALLTYAPAWASGSDNDKVAPRNPADISGVAAAATARYAPQGVHAWEVWNEPNISSAWAPKPDPQLYAQLLAATSRAIRSVDATATIVSGGLSPAGDAADGTTVAPLTFLKTLYAAGAGSSFTAVGMHPYSFPAMPMQVGTEDWNSFIRLPLLHSLMTANGDAGKKIWLTEFGAPTGTSSAAVSSDVQVSGIQQAFDQLPQWSWAGPLFYYSLKDAGTDPTDREQNFGLVRNDFSAKPSLAAFTREMTKAITVPVKVPPVTPSGTWLSDLTPTSAVNGYGPLERDRSNGEAGAGDGTTLSLRGATYPKGLGVHADSSVSYAVPAGASTFSATVGVDDEVRGKGSVVFRVFADGQQIWQSPRVTGTSPAVPVSLDLHGAKVLRLVAWATTDGSSYDHADWAGASLH